MFLYMFPQYMKLHNVHLIFAPTPHLQFLITCSMQIQEVGKVGNEAKYSSKILSMHTAVWLQSILVW